MAKTTPQIDDRNTARILTELTDCSASGDVVELGCYQGDTSVKMARLLKDSGRKLFLYDSFEGLPEKTAQDSTALGQSFQPGQLKTSKNELLRRFAHLNLPRPIVKKAWFKDLTPNDLPKQIAFALLDGDFYESIKDSFKLIENRLAQHAIIVVDDYANPALKGVEQAVREWLAENQTKNAQLEQFGVLATIHV